MTVQKFKCEYTGRQPCASYANYTICSTEQKMCSRHIQIIYNLNRSAEQKVKKFGDIEESYYTGIDYKSEEVKQALKALNGEDESNQASLVREDQVLECVFVENNKNCRATPKYLYKYLESGELYCRKHVLVIANQSGTLETEAKSIKDCKTLCVMIDTKKLTDTPATTESNVSQSSTTSKKSTTSSTSKVTKKMNSLKLTALTDDVIDEVNSKVIEHMNSKASKTYKLSSMIGKGTCGRVYGVTDSDGIEQPFVVKISYFDSNNPEYSRRLMDTIYSEYLIISQKLHDNTSVTKLVDKDVLNGLPYNAEKDTYAYLVMKRYGVSLKDMIKKDYMDKHILSIMTKEEFIKKIGLQLIKIITYLHTKKNIIYVDMKPENILKNTDSDDPTAIVLTDFGITSRWLNPRGDINDIVDLGQTYGSDLYASQNSNNMKSSSRIDDIETIFYILLYIHLDGVLPWSSEKSVKAILKRKVEFLCSMDSEELPKYLLWFCQHTKNYVFQEKPDYAEFAHILGVPRESGYSDVEDEVKADS